VDIAQSEVEPEAGAVRPVASDRTDIVTVVLGTWFTVGLLLDAWAHNNKPDLETFFTPWHAVFYSGFAATAAWIAWTVRDGLRGGRFDVRAVPVGYASSAVAVVGFALAGGGDLAWHTAFGVEQEISILFSPTHVGLVASMLVIVSTPVRAMWADRSLAPAPGLRRLLPAVLSVALATTLVLLFLQYANAETLRPRAIMVGLSNVDEGDTARLVTSMAMTNLVLVAPLLTLARRWVLPFGTATLLAIVTGALSAAVGGLRDPEPIAGIVVAAVAVDVLAFVMRPTPDRLVRYRAFGGLAALFLWCGYLVAAFGWGGGYLTGPDSHPEGALELVTGTPLVQCGIGVLLAVLLVPSRPVPPAPSL
jgi:hypothetical protein